MSFDIIKDIALVLLTPTVIVAIVWWMRFRKIDDAKASEIRAKADVLITDGALRIVERLSKDLDEARDEIEKLLVVVASMKVRFEKDKEQYKIEADGMRKIIKNAHDLIETKRRHCIDIKARIIRLQELLLLKQKGLSQEQLEDFINKLNELISLPLPSPNISSS